LIAAAHAGCFSMALSAQLGGANLTASSIETSATLTMEKLDSGWTITAIHLDVVGRVPGADDAAFQKAAGDAKAGCPVSKVLNAKITMSAKLEG
jgi:osmotically inducible protein OsmC